jgi:HEAT repeat protein
VQSIAARLDSSNADEVREAIALLSVIDDPSVVPPLARLLRSGRSDEVTDAALLALRGLAEPSSVEVLVDFSRHRRARARRLAYQARASIQDPRVPGLLEQGLRDSDRTIRGTAARALGEIGARQSIETLFVAFDRGVVEAASAIGKLGDAQSVRRFSEHLGRAPLSVMLSGFGEYLARADIAEQVKLDIIGRLGEVSGPQVRAFLQRYLETIPAAPARGSSAARGSRLREVVVETLRRIPPGSSGPSAAGGAQ